MTLGARIVALLFLLSVAAVVIEEQHLARQRAQLRAAQLRVANASAERDTTRLVVTEDDSARVYQRQVIQLEQKNDALDRQLGGERRARYAMSALIDSLRANAVAPIERDSSSHPRSAHFALRQEPYTIDAHVELPDPPDTLLRLRFGIALDTIHATLRLTCGALRVASVAAEVPPWLTLKFGRVEQHPDVCNEPPAERRVHLTPLVGVGRSVTTPHFWALFVGFGVAFQ